MKPTLHEDWIDPYAFQIVRNLQEGGFETYLVGGCVRDLLAGTVPKDFDIATNALPNQVKRRINNSYVIGRRFKLVLARRGVHQFEIATFRRQASEEELADEHNEIEGDNFFGTPEEDAKRRDFTINGLFYDPVQKKVIDYVQGLKDVEACRLRMIGEPYARLMEDPIRILRAIRLSHKLKFSLDEDLRKAIPLTVAELKKSVLPRRREEWLKFLRLPDPLLAFQELYDLGALKEVLGAFHLIFADDQKLEIFKSHFLRFRQAHIHFDDPVELFAAFVFSLAKAHLGEDFSTEQIFADKGFQVFMREELGVFKIELGSLERTLALMPALKKKDNYLRRGERRKASFVANDILPLALKLGEIDLSLSAADILFWKNQMNEFSLG